MSTQYSRRVYFSGLNALRFYAALSVMIVHISTNFGELRTQSAIYPLLDSLVMDAQSAVNLFFVLSGFLITYLLLDEQARTHTISVRRFYARRILRIWPLYYLIALVGFVVLPLVLGQSYALYAAPTRSIVLVFLFLANFVGPLGALGHLWSISLEEQFYLVWPWVVRDQQRLLKVAFGVIIVKLAITPVIDALHVDSISMLFTSLRFECMAIGAVFAYLYFTRHASLNLLYSRPVQAVALLIIGYVILFDVPLTTLIIMVTSLAFGVLILNVATNPGSWIKLNYGWLNRFGEASYGIYMYHFVLLYVVLFLLKSAGLPEGDTYNALLYVVTIAGTLILSFVSYRWFESPFLRLKTRFGVVEPPAVRVVAVE